MFTTDSSKSIMTRVGTSLKVAAMLVLLGLLVVATERPMLLSPADAVTRTEEASYVAERVKALPLIHGASVAAASATGDFDYLPSHFAAPAGPSEDLPPQF